MATKPAWLEACDASAAPRKRWGFEASVPPSAALAAWEIGVAETLLQPLRGSPDGWLAHHYFRWIE
jgi:hypothetical protein